MEITLHTSILKYLQIDKRNMNLCKTNESIKRRNEYNVYTKTQQTF